MISNEEAIQILEAQVKKGVPLVTGGHADLVSVKRLLEQCLHNNIPAVLGPCSKGG